MSYEPKRGDLVTVPSNGHPEVTWRVVERMPELDHTWTLRTDPPLGWNDCTRTSRELELVERLGPLNAGYEITVRSDGLGVPVTVRVELTHDPRMQWQSRVAVDDQPMSLPLDVNATFPATEAAKFAVLTLAQLFDDPEVKAMAQLRTDRLREGA